jgi:NAD(P)H-flavin reductase
VRIEEELAGRALLSRFDGTWLTYRPVLSRPRDEGGWRGLTGRVGDHLRDLLAAHGFRRDRMVAYLCGNPSMIADCEVQLVGVGAPATSIRTERFTATTSD